MQFLKRYITPQIEAQTGQDTHNYNNNQGNAAQRAALGETEVSMRGIHTPRTGSDELALVGRGKRIAAPRGTHQRLPSQLRV